MSVKHGHYEQFYPQQPLSENVHFQNYSNKDYFIGLTSTFIELYVILKTSNSEKSSAAEGSSYENYVLHNLFRQISCYINGTLEAQATMLQIMEVIHNSC